MERKQVYITKSQSEKVKALSEKTGLSMAEIIRRSLDEYLKKGKNNE